MPATLTAILERLAQTNSRANYRYIHQNYSDETHLMFLSFDLRELLRDIDDSIRNPIPVRRRAVPPNESTGHKVQLRHQQIS